MTCIQLFINHFSFIKNPLKKVFIRWFIIYLFHICVKTYWFVSCSLDFLQTPWLWNTKECWYNYPYQVKVFQPSMFNNFQQSWCGKMTCITQIFILTLLLFVFTQPLTVDIHYYYILELSFYLSLLFSQFTDIRRKVRRTAVYTYTYCTPCISNNTDHRVFVKRTLRQKLNNLFVLETRKSCSVFAIISSAVTQKMSLPLPDCPSLFLLSPRLHNV